MTSCLFWKTHQVRKQSHVQHASEYVTRYVSIRHHQAGAIRSAFVTKIIMQKILVILWLYWNPITLVLIWRVLRQAFRWCHKLFLKSFHFWAILLFEIFAKYLQSLKGYVTRSIFHMDGMLVLHWLWESLAPSPLFHWYPLNLCQSIAGISYDITITKELDR
jgi:hypothetical protein